MAEKNQQNQQNQRGFSSADESMQRDMSQQRNDDATTGNTDPGRSNDMNRGGQER